MEATKPSVTEWETLQVDDDPVPQELLYWIEKQSQPDGMKTSMIRLAEDLWIASFVPDEIKNILQGWVKGGADEAIKKFNNENDLALELPDLLARHPKI